ncbi:MAG: diaminopimelate dehydrogenase [Victivallaceae bacterium]|nr:diaminopimelate dehydrogenase [Victivallaceae bacterium]
MQIRVMIVGYGNVGRGVRCSIERQPDMMLCGIASRSPQRVMKEVSDVPVMDVSDIDGWLARFRPDVAILCGGSKDDLPKQGPEYCRVVNTVDSFDNHSRIPEYFHTMDDAARACGHVSVISTGWDPGIFSLERVLGGSFLPGSRAYGFYGLGPAGGLSMGHSDAIRTIKGVVDARQYTHAVPEAVERVRRGENPDFKPGDMHTRECFVVVEEGADKARIEREILEMPGYFAPYRTVVNFVSKEELAERCAGFPHDGLVVTAGVTGPNSNPAVAEYRCNWGSNPEATANVLVAHARAAFRLSEDGCSGAFTILDIPPAYFSAHDREELLKHWM